MALGGSKLRVQRQLRQGLETLRGNREKLLEKRLGRPWADRVPGADTGDEDRHLAWLGLGLASTLLLLRLLQEASCSTN